MSNTRLKQGTNIVLNSHDPIKIEGKFLHWVKVNDEQINLSPEWCVWGYGGSGPTEVAANILDHLGIEFDRTTAITFSQQLGLRNPDLTRKDFTLHLTLTAHAHHDKD